MHTETHTHTHTHTHPARTPMLLLCGLPQPPAVLSAAARCQQSGVWVKIRLVEGLGKIRAFMTVHCQVDVVINLPVHHSLLPLSLGLRHLYWPLFRRHRTPRYKLFCERFHHHSPFFRASTLVKQMKMKKTCLKNLSRGSTLTIPAFQTGPFRKQSARYSIASTPTVHLRDG